jgi:4-diphosphocytidyl-2-C-methyl-D-erythritol kinase
VTSRGAAPAKVNLYLEVVGRRPDGFHEIATLFQTVGLADEVEVESRSEPGVSCEVAGAALPDGEANLAVAAATRYLEAAGRPVGVRLRLAKRIPVGGGLGGGSSDAAAVLRLLEAEHGALGGAGLVDVARSLGADVPFLLVGGTAIGRGLGERLEALRPPPPLPLVLIVPPFPTHTAVVYGAWTRPPRPAPADGLRTAVEALASGEPARVRDAHRNDLAFAAMRAYPDLARFAARVERLLGRPPCLTGSGSTLFDVPDPGEVEATLARLAGLPGRREPTTTT